MVESTTATQWTGSQAPPPQEYSWENINEGTYVEKNTGRLIRVPAKALIEGHSPAIQVESLEPLRYVKLSDDVAFPSLRAKMLCGTFGIPARFPA